MPATTSTAAKTKKKKGKSPPKKVPAKNKVATTSTESPTTTTATTPRKQLCQRYQKLAESQRSFKVSTNTTPTPTTTVGNSITTAAANSISKQQKDWLTKTNNSPATTMKKCLQYGITSIPDFLYEGIQVIKITSNGSYQKRILTISQDKLALFCTHDKINNAKGAVSMIASTLPIPIWTPSRGFGFSSNKSLRDRYVRYIDIADLHDCIVGVVGTQTLENAVSRASGGKLLEGRLRNQIVTILYKGYETLNVVIENEIHRNALLTALHSMKQIYDTVERWIGNESLLLRYIWYDVDVDGSGRISCTEFAQNICPRINLQLPNAIQLYKDFVTKLRTKEGDSVGGTGTNSKSNNSTELTYGECMALLQSVKPKLPSHELWDTMFGSTTTSVTAQELWSKFLSTTQGEIDTTLDDAEALLTCMMSLELDEDEDAWTTTTTTTNKKEKGKKMNNPSPTLSRSRFVSFLHSDFNNAFDPEKQELPTTIQQKLDQPMSYYWINTSHNTYLTGDQLKSRSSVEAYMRSLYRGCKCLELDCWNGDDPSEKDLSTKSNSEAYIPIVFHGHTLTSKIRFSEIIHVVDNYLTAHPDSYPIILSLENHCSHPFQRSMAELMTTILGKKLFVPTKEQAASGDLPSPESLKGMAVIKGKRPPDKEDKEEEAKASGGSVRIGSNVSDMDDDEDDPYEPAATTTTTTASATAADPKKDVKPSKIVPELASLTLFHGTKYKSFETSMVQAKSHMHSIGESKIAKLINDKKHPNNADLWRQYNVHHMTRTYPAGARVDSSNYNPIVAWAVGSQLVALNFQTHDTPLIINDGRFRQNGNCGYLLKPKSIMREENGDGDGDDNNKEKPPKMELKIRVLSGNCLPKPKGEKSGETIDPYVKVVVFDVQGGGGGSGGKREELVSSSHTTSGIDNNGFCPVWNDAGKTFTVHTPDVAMVVFDVIDDDYVGDDNIASAAIPISCLRKGYRSIQLYDPHSNSRSGAFQYATLLVEIQY